MADYEFVRTILPVKEREKTKDRWLKGRLATILPAIMDKHQLDLWVIVGREYHEDPIVETLLPAAVDSSRRLTKISGNAWRGSYMRRTLGRLG